MDEDWDWQWRVEWSIESVGRVTIQQWRRRRLTARVGWDGVRGSPCVLNVQAQWVQIGEDEVVVSNNASDALWNDDFLPHHCRRRHEEGRNEHNWLTAVWCVVVASRSLDVMSHWHLLGGGGESIHWAAYCVHTESQSESEEVLCITDCTVDVLCTVVVVVTRREEEWNEERERERERRPFALDLVQQRWWRRSFIPFIFNNDEEEKKNKTKWTGGGGGDGGACVRACCCSLLAGYQLHTVCQWQRDKRVADLARATPEYLIRALSLSPSLSSWCRTPLTDPCRLQPNKKRKENSPTASAAAVLQKEMAKKRKKKERNGKDRNRRLFFWWDELNAWERGRTAWEEEDQQFDYVLRITKKTAMMTTALMKNNYQRQAK